MKKHLIAALAGVMLVAVTAPAFAANVTGNLSFGYNYDLGTMTPTDGLIDSEWGLSLSGNISDDVTVGIGFTNVDAKSDLALIPSEAWIQAKNTPFGTIKLGAFEMAFGEDDFNVTSIDEGLLSVQVANEFAGIAVTGGIQFANDGRAHALGAAASVNLLDSLQGTVGALAKNEGGTWGDPAIGYQVAYTGFPNLTLGLRGNLKQEEIAVSAAYQLLPGMRIYGLAGQNVPNEKDDVVDTQIVQAGIGLDLTETFSAGASYSVFQRADGEHRVVALTGDYELAKGLVVGLSGEYSSTNSGTPETAFGASVGLSF